jgi:hypothetical protein
VSTVRKSQASTLRCLRLQERAPRGRGPLRSRWERCFEQHLPYRGRGYADPSSLEFTDESPVARVRILTDERRIIARSDGSSGGRPGLMHICPAVGDELTVPAQQGVRLDREARPRRPGVATGSAPPAACDRLGSASAAGPAGAGSRTHGGGRESRIPSSDAAVRAGRRALEQVPQDEIHKRPVQAALPRPRLRAAEPSDARQSRGRACEPYAFC